MTVSCSFLDVFPVCNPHFQDEIRGKKPYTPVKSTVDPKKLKLDGNSGKENQEPKSKENQGKVIEEKENIGTENIVKVNFEKEKNGEKTGKESRQTSLGRSKCSASKMPLESKDTNVKAP